MRVSVAALSVVSLVLLSVVLSGVQARMEQQTLAPAATKPAMKKPTSTKATTTTATAKKNATVKKGPVIIENNRTVVDQYIKKLPNISTVFNISANVTKLIQALEKLDEAEDKIKWDPLHGKTIKLAVWKHILVEANHGLQIMVRYWC